MELQQVALRRLVGSPKKDTLHEERPNSMPFFLDCLRHLLMSVWHGKEASLVKSVEHVRILSSLTS